MKLLRTYGPNLNEHGFGSHIIFPVLVILAVAAIGVYELHDGHAATLVTSTASDATVTINPGDVLTTIPNRYLGFSFEASSLCALTGNRDTPAFQQLVENLGPQVVRVGGNSVDHATWDPTGTASCGNNTVLTEPLLSSFFNMAHTMNTKVMMTLNLGGYNPTAAANEATYLINEGGQIGGTNGSYLWAIGIGNEPDLYSGNGLRPTGWPLSGGTGDGSYISAWNTYRDAVRQTSGHPSFKFMGSDSGGNTTWFTTFLNDEQGSLSYATHHYYGISQNNPPCSPNNPYSKDHSSCTNSVQDYESDLLGSQLMTRTAGTVSSWAKDAGNVPLAINEANSVTGGGEPGVSNTLTASLWGLDFLYTALENGARQVNFHDNGGAAYTPISFSNSGQATPQALYYAMLAFHYGASSGNLVSTSVSSSDNVTAYSVSRNGTLNVTVVNKGSKPATTSIVPPSSYKTASSITLSAPSLTSTSPNITLGNAVASVNGTWTPKLTSIKPTNGNWFVTIPADSAMIVKLYQ